MPEGPIWGHRVLSVCDKYDWDIDNQQSQEVVACKILWLECHGERHYSHQVTLETNEKRVQDLGQYK